MPEFLRDGSGKSSATRVVVAAVVIPFMVTWSVISIGKMELQPIHFQESSPIFAAFGALVMAKQNERQRREGSLPPAGGPAG